MYSNMSFEMFSVVAKKALLNFMFNSKLFGTFWLSTLDETVN
jgi:hypothetical protein